MQPTDKRVPTVEQWEALADKIEGAGGGPLIINFEWNATTSRYETSTTYTEITTALNSKRICIVESGGGWHGFVQAASGSNNVFARVGASVYDSPNWKFEDIRLAHDGELVYEYTRDEFLFYEPTSPASISAMANSQKKTVSESALKSILTALEARVAALEGN